MAYTRPLDDIRVGGEIDAVCTRCRIMTNHRIVAMVDGLVKRVICLTCQSQHNYRQPPGEKRPQAAKVMRVSKEMKKTSAPDGGRVFAQWMRKKQEMEAAELSPRAYGIAEKFEVDEALNHPKFGLGFVQRLIPPNKMEVMFETEIKTLVMNMGG
ncbi:hypothetical protein LJB99_04280 [Deltaproteobacteria bacterium OttesenSCG-928-K17]|nr:hypothetical protein [Deltaproteobacteria bacterium OttesenSCG-928-K17]